MGNVYVFLANGFEELEALGTVDILRRAGLNVLTVSLTGTRLVSGSHDVVVSCDELFDESCFCKVGALILPGGMPGAVNLSEHEGLNLLITKCYRESNVLLTAICAGPMVYGKLGLLKGLKATCYPGFEKYLEGAEVTGELVEQDGLFITGKGPGAIFDFAFRIVREMLGEEKAKELKAVMMIKE